MGIVGPVYLSNSPAVAVNDAYCATTSGVGGGPAAAVGRGFAGAGFLAAFLTRAFVTFAGEDFLTAPFRTVTLAGAFLPAPFAASARFSAHRFLVAATIAALPALLSLRLAFGAFGVFGDSAATICG